MLSQTKFMARKALCFPTLQVGLNLLSRATQRTRCCITQGFRVAYLPIRLGLHVFLVSLFLDGKMDVPNGSHKPLENML